MPYGRHYSFLNGSLTLYQKTNSFRILQNKRISRSSIRYGLNTLMLVWSFWKVGSSKGTGENVVYGHFQLFPRCFWDRIPPQDSSNVELEGKGKLTNLTFHPWNVCQKYKNPSRKNRRLEFTFKSHFRHLSLVPWLVKSVIPANHVLAYN